MSALMFTLLISSDKLLVRDLAACPSIVRTSLPAADDLSCEEALNGIGL